MPKRKRNMDKHQFTEYLLSFGLTRQEAGVYEKLLLNGKQTGYEAAKETEFPGRMCMELSRRWWKRGRPML